MSAAGFAVIVALAVGWAAGVVALVLHESGRMIREVRGEDQP